MPQDVCVFESESMGTVLLLDGKAARMAGGKCGGRGPTPLQLRDRQL